MQNRRWLIVGITGSGKSYFTISLINKYVALKQRGHVVIVDSTDAYKEEIPYLKHCEVKPLDYSQIDFERIITEHQNVLFEVSGLLPKQDVLFMDALCKSIMEVQDILLVVDEAHRYLPKDKPSNEFLILLREGRKHYIDSIIITQFPIDLNLIARRQANSLVVFKLLDDTDTEKVAYYLEMKPEEIRDLELFDFLLKDRNTGEMIKGRL
ncbi:MAG: DUF87 domain-containing protein [Clostridia bacterium]|jgi:DNA helicase HerA-like ATPase|nr:DUF87 domain-containing protein [Clostridia bacterium]